MSADRVAPNASPTAVTADFRSDNVGGVAPQILEAILAANTGSAASYGADELSARLQRRYSELFERAVDVFPVPTGTAANAIALSACTPPWGAILCHPNAHAHTSECGATELFSGGAKFMPVGGSEGKLDLQAVRDALRQSGRGEAHRSQPTTLTVTQASELGTTYSLDSLRDLAAIAREHGLAMHMDGARLANAIAHLGCSPADITWRSGVDLLSFGATKNGGMMCDAIVVFRRELAESLSFRLRRAGHGWSKMRFASVQLLAYAEDDLWLRLAERANTLARMLGDGIVASGRARLAVPVEANEVFAYCPEPVVQALERGGIMAIGKGDELLRFVCRFDMTLESVDRCLEVFRTADSPLIGQRSL